MQFADWFDLVDSPRTFLLAALLAVPVCFQIGRMIFDGWDDFLDCLKTWYLPIWLNVWRGEAENIHIRFLSVALFLLLSLLAIAAIYKGLLAGAQLLHFGT